MERDNDQDTAEKIEIVPMVPATNDVFSENFISPMGSRFQIRADRKPAGGRHQQRGQRMTKKIRGRSARPCSPSPEKLTRYGRDQQVKSSLSQ
jgi:hypothetical protein